MKVAIAPRIRGPNRVAKRISPPKNVSRILGDDEAKYIRTAKNRLLHGEPLGH